MKLTAYILSVIITGSIIPTCVSSGPESVPVSDLALLEEQDVLTGANTGSTTDCPCTKAIIDVTDTKTVILGDYPRTPMGEAVALSLEGRSACISSVAAGAATASCWSSEAVPSIGEYESLSLATVAAGEGPRANLLGKDYCTSSIAKDVATTKCKDLKIVQVAGL